MYKDETEIPQLSRVLNTNHCSNVHNEHFKVLSNTQQEINQIQWRIQELPDVRHQVRGGRSISLLLWQFFLYLKLKENGSRERGRVPGGPSLWIRQ